MKQQEGFTFVEALLTVLVISIIGFGGYTVWNNSQNDETEFAENSQQETERQNSEEENALEGVSSDIDGWVEYTYTQGGLAISHPNTWSVSVEQNGNKLVLKSADFEAGTEEYVAVHNGELLEVSVKSSEGNFDTIITSLKEAQSLHGGEFKELIVAGERAVFSTIKSHGSHVNVFVYKDGNEYLFRYDNGNVADLGLEEKIVKYLDTVRFL